MSRKIDFFDGAQSSTVPTIGNLVASGLIQYTDDAQYEAAEQGSPIEGNIYFNTTSKLIRYYNGTEWIDVVDEKTAQTVQNKIIDGTSATGNNTVTTDADDVTYDNSTSSLAATDVQAAVDEVEGRLDTAEADIDDLETLSGVPGATNLGTFTGTTIADSETNKGAMQDLEDGVEARILLTEKGAANGVAELDAGAKVPVSQLPDSVTGAVYYLGTWNASTNTPSLSDGSGAQGDYYVVSVAGSTSLDGITDWKVGDWVIASTTVWEKVDNTDAVTSVAGKTGIVTLDTDDVSEATNLYYTNTRADARIAAASIDDLSDVDTTTSPPASGEALVWDGSNWAPDVVSGGSGEGGINYIDNGKFETDTSGWATYDDGDVAEPVDGTGSPTGSIFITRVDFFQSVISDNASGRLSVTSAASRRGEGLSYDFGVDLKDINGVLNLSFDYATKVGFWDNNDIQVWIYDIDNAVMLGPVTNDDVGFVLTNDKRDPTIEGSTRFTGRFETSDSVNYRLIFHVTSTLTINREMNFDNVKVGPDELVPGAIITEWEDFTPVGSWTTNTTYTGKMRRVGDSLDIDIKIDLSGAPDAVPLTVDLPSGLNVDSSKITDLTGETRNLGLVSIRDTGTGDTAGRISFTTSDTNTLSVFIEGAAASYVNLASVTNAIPHVFATGDVIHIKADGIPIDGWSAGAMLSTTEVNHLTANFRHNSVIAQSIPNSTTSFYDFTNPVYDTHNGYQAGVTYTPATGVWVTDPGYIVPRSGKYQASASLMFSSVAWTSGESGALALYKNGTIVSWLAVRVIDGSVTKSLKLDGNDTILCNKGDVLSIGVYQATGAALTILGGGGTEVYNYFTVEEIPDFTTFSIYGETDYKAFNGGSDIVWPFVAAQWGDFTSFDLEPGEWDLSFEMVIVNTTGSANINSSIGVSTTAGNSGAGMTRGINTAETTINTQWDAGLIGIGNYRVILTSTTTHYLKGLANSLASGIWTKHWRVSARKIK